MQTIKKLKTQSKRFPNEYVNIETGETLASEATTNVHITMKEDTQYFTIDSDEYIVFDSGAMEYLNRVLPKSDMARVLQMGNMVKGDCSILFQKNNIPHDSNTLPNALQLSQDKFYKMARTLVKKGILSYCVCAPSGYVQKIYMLNPYVARKRKVLNCELNTIFKDISKPENQR
jgi:hypothetical protein